MMGLGGFVFDVRSIALNHQSIKGYIIVTSGFKEPYGHDAHNIHHQVGEDSGLSYLVPSDFAIVLGIGKFGLAAF